MPRFRYCGRQIKAKEAKETCKVRKKYEQKERKKESEREKDEEMRGRAVYGRGSQPNPDLNPISTHSHMTLCELCNLLEPSFFFYKLELIIFTSEAIMRIK